MPNHTSTILTLTGNQSEVKRFIAAVDTGTDGNHLNFDGVVPLPSILRSYTSPAKIVSQSVLDEEKKLGITSVGITQCTSDRLNSLYGANNWYDWARRNWGTKWGAYDSGEWNLEVDETTGVLTATISYNTAWSPATEFFLNASKLFPSLTFEHKFSDEGGSFVGTESIENGDIVYTVDVEWDSDEGITIREELGTYYPEDDVTEDGVVTN